MRVSQQGRAILRRLTVHDVSRGFRPGDFLLTTSDGGLARLQGWAADCELNHAALIIDSLGTVVEANPSLTGGPKVRPFRTGSVRDYLESGQPCWIGFVELREGSRQTVVAYAEHLLRTQRERGGSGRFWLALHTLLSITPRTLAGRAAWLNGVYRWLNDHAVVLREEHCLLSGELVARALERGGFIWESDPANVTPADLFASFHHFDTLLEPLPLAARRRSTGQREPQLAPDHAAAITTFAPRRTRGATALREEPSEVEAPQAGIQALTRVGVLMAASLAMIGIVEETIRLVAREG